MIKRILIFFLIFGIITTAITLYSIWQYNLPLVSPLALIENYIAPPGPTDKIVYGFFPYWNLKYAEKLHINDLTHFAYFSLSLNEDGSIQKKVNPRELEPGWNKLNSSSLDRILYQVKLLNKKIVLTITAMEPEIITGILNSSSNQETALNSILQVFTEKQFDGINIDFESVSSPDKETRDNFTGFIEKLKARCLIVKNTCEVDIDIFADSDRRNRLYDLSALSPTVDHIIVMTYDYYRKSSSQAGPIAPLRGACPTPIGFAQLMDPPQGCLEQDVTTNLSEIASIVPSEKLILGIPFYGYEWQTVSTDFLSNTYSGTGALASYQRVRDLFSDTTISSLSATWSATTLSPYLTYQTDGETRQIHYEDPYSVELKTKLIKSANLGGLAIWALGYEVPYLDIWQPIHNYLLDQ